MKKTSVKTISYRSAGVNIAKAETLVQWIKKQAPARPSNLRNDYASLLDFPSSQYKNPVLAASTDGVGTKLKLAAYFNEWEGVGQDLVAMCVNDLICVGAKPLFFLDYYACGRLNLKQAKAFLKGVIKACRESDCPLVGGETAELTGLYKAPDLDCAGFCVGVVERAQVLSPLRVRPGDKILGLKSSGFHSNGYSLLRKLYPPQSPGLKKHKKSLLQPTRLYTFLKPHRQQIKGLRAMAHITGGGLDNLSRVLPPHLNARLKPWALPAPFREVKSRAKLSWKQLLKTFNCGIGLVLIVKDQKSPLKNFPKEEAIELGQVEESPARGGKWLLNLKDMDRLNS